jgi:alginate O-acetyltransferase complex protein AlgI
VLFNSVQFLVFFAVTLAFFTVSGRRRWLLILLSSYVFYMAWKWQYAFLIIFSTLVDYRCGIAVEDARSKSRKQFFLGLSLFCNLSLLFVLKYFNFFISAVETLTDQSLYHSNLLLPVGISFYTFQTMGYTIDVYKGRIPAERHLGLFSLYVIYFPQLVAGPIERAGNLLSQFRDRFQFRFESVYQGLKLAVWGLFKKVVIADRVALFVDPIFNNPNSYSAVTLALATLFFSIQIYCDFSGYSDIAIGVSRVLGVDLMKNFDCPYFSKSIGEFWKRWHISLSTWFRDYLYIPLGGNRVSSRRWAFNILLTFVVSGLWHGANWTFLVWGGLHGLYLLIERRAVLLQSLPGAARMLLTCLQVNLAWVYFRADSISDANAIINSLFTGQWSYSLLRQELAATGATKLDFLLSLFFIGFLLLTDASRHYSKPFLVKLLFYVTILISIFLFGVDTSESFIYFQF